MPASAATTAGALSWSAHSRTRGAAGCGAAWLAHLTGGQGVAGSNPVSPTIETPQDIGTPGSTGRRFGGFVLSGGCKSRRHTRACEHDRDDTQIDLGHVGQARTASRSSRSRQKGDGDWAVTPDRADRKSTRLNSSHVKISYAVFCLKKKKTKISKRM